MKKKILVTMHHPPFGNFYISEGLRAAVGISSGFDEHSVDMLFLGEGVYCALKSVDYKDHERFFRQLKSVHAQLFLDRDALSERGIASEEISPEFIPVSRGEIVEKLKEYDFNLDY